MTDVLLPHAPARTGIHGAVGVRFLLLAAVTIAALGALGLPRSARAETVVAPPAVVSACQVQRATDAKTANTPELVSGPVGLAGCIADGGSGVSHLYADWSGPNGTSGHVCADPAIGTDGSWTCIWNTDALPDGAYTVTLTAYDLAGNRGSFDRKYDVEHAQAPPSTRAPDPIPPPSAQPGSSTSTGSTTTAPPATGSTTTDMTPPTGAIAPQTTTTTSPTTSAGTSATTAPPPVDPTTTIPEPDSDTDVLPIAPQLPTADGLDAMQRLVLDEIETCAQQQSITLAANPSAAPDAAAQVALICVKPALVQLGASSEDVDDLPIPPALRIVFPDTAQLASAQQVLPLTIAGVPLELETQAQYDAQQVADAPSTDTGSASSTGAPSMGTTTTGTSTTGTATTTN